MGKMGKRKQTTPDQKCKEEMTVKTQLAEPTKIQVDADKLQKGLTKLVLTLVEILRQILEKQGQRRIAQGTLTPQEIERLGMSFMQIKQTIDEVAGKFDLKPQELNLNVSHLLGAGAKTQNRASLVDLIDKLLDKGTVLGGNITISVADIDLISLNLLAMLSSVRPIQSTKQELNR
jgi:hypothetical protein